MLNQNNNKSSLGLNANAMYDWKSRPRQPSGASAQRPQESMYGSTKGVANSAGVPKFGAGQSMSSGMNKAASMLSAAQVNTDALSLSPELARQSRRSQMFVNSPVAQREAAMMDMGRSQTGPAMPVSQAIPQRPAAPQQQTPDQKLAAAQQYYNSVRNLESTGRPDYSDYNMKTGLRNQVVEDNNRSLEAAVDHQGAGGGLRYRPTSTAFGTPEQARQAAADFRGMYGAEQAATQAAQRGLDGQFNRFQESRVARDNAQAERGLDPVAARRDIDRLSAQFAAITKQGVAPGVRFVDFVQQEIDAGRMSPSSSAIQIIEENYGHKFKRAPLQDLPLSVRAQEYGFAPETPQTQPVGPEASLIELARANAARERREQQEADQPRRDMLKQQATQQGAARAAYAADFAALRGQGLSPQQANLALGQQAAMQSFYNAQAMPARIKADADTAVADLNNRAQLTSEAMQGQNRIDLKEMELDAEAQVREAERDSRMRQREDEKGQFAADAYQRGMSAGLTGDPGDPNTPMGMHIAREMALRYGTPMPNVQQSATQGLENATPSQRELAISMATGKVSEDSRINIQDSPISRSMPLALNTMQRQNMPEDMQLEALGRLYNKNLSNPAEAIETAKEIFRSSRSSMEQAGRESGVVMSPEAKARQMQAELMANKPVLDLLKKSSRLDDKKFNQLIFGGAYDTISTNQRSLGILDYINPF